MKPFKLLTKIGFAASFFLRFALLAGCLFALCCAPAYADSQRRELRAFWADGFNEGYKTPQQIDTLLQRLHDAHCNTIFAQMRKGGDAYYASHYEPWASDDLTHFDALACLIDRAHRMQPPIAVHAWINTCAVGPGEKHPGYHVAQRHPEWLSTNPSGNSDDDEVRKIDPGNPDAADWTFRLYLDVVRHYDVDGIHFDFVRYGGKRFGYNSVSVTRFLHQLPTDYPLHFLPAPDDPAWKQWRRDQVTNLVRKVYAHAVQLNPHVVVSAATIAWGNGPHNEDEWQRKSAAMNLVFQDWRSWLREGVLDLACPMTYFSGRRGLEYERVWSDWIKAHQYQRACTVAVGNFALTIPRTLEQMEIARRPDAEGRRPYGAMLYSYASTNMGTKPGKPGLHARAYQPEFYAMLGQSSPYAKIPPFAADVLPPSMPWKTQRGLIKGFVHTTALMPLDGALVTLETSKETAKLESKNRPVRLHRTQRTEGTGFYAFVDMPPGTYTLRVAAPRSTPKWKTTTQQVTVVAGQAATCHFQAVDDRLPDAPAIETLPELQAVLPLADASATQTPRPVRFAALTVVVGTDTDLTKSNLYVQDKQGFCLRVRLAAPPPLPFQPGDVIAVLGTPAQITPTFSGAPIDANDPKELALINATACLTDITLLPKSALVPAIPLPSLALDSHTHHGFVRVRGRVVQSSAEHFTLQRDKEANNNEAKKANKNEEEDKNTGSLQVIVPIADRKDFGVESTTFLPAPLLVGSVVTVTGLVPMNVSSENGIRRIWFVPRASADIILISAPPARGDQRWMAKAALFLAMPILVLFVLLFLFWLRRRQGVQRSGS